jgi:DNA repair protein RecO (recombination protein O)
VRRIVRSEALCLRVQDYHESSKLVTFFTLEHGKVSCLAKGARRLRSKFGAALDLFAQSRVIYYSHETRTLLTLSDAELVHSFSSLALRPERFLAAEQMAEFALRVIQPHDPSPQLYRLLLNYLSTLENLQSPGPRPAAPNLFPALVCSFLMKAASFLGFRPELRRCLICRRPIEGPSPAYFDAGRGGVVCRHCAGERRDMTESAEDSDRVPSLTRLDAASLDTLAFLLYTPASEIARVFSSGPEPATGDDRQGRQDSGPDNLQSAICGLQSPLELVLGFLGHHFDPLVLNSFHWHARLERNA